MKLMTVLVLCIMAFGVGRANAANLLSSADITFDSGAGTRYVQTTGTDSMVVNSAGGLNLNALTSIQINSGSGYQFIMQSASGSDMNLNSGGNVVLWPSDTYQVIVYGGLTLNSFDTQPACGPGFVGTFWYQQSIDTSPDTLSICMNTGSYTYAWVTK